MKRLIASLYSYALQIIRVVFSIQVKVNPVSICIQYQSLFGFYLTSRLQPNKAQCSSKPVFITFIASIQVKFFPVSIPYLISSFKLLTLPILHNCQKVIAVNTAKTCRMD